MKKFGIDISVWQKGFNFDKAKAEGVEFAILRGAYHMSKDKCFEDFYKACKTRSIPVGVYHYSMATTVTEAKEEANFLVSSVLKGKQLEYPVYMDVEDKTQAVLGKDKLTAIIVAFCKTLEDAGYYVGIYSTANFLKTYTDESKLAAYDKWIAHWAKECTYIGNYGVWQFGGETNLIRTNKVAGVTCDQDYALKDYPAIIKKAGLNGYGKVQHKSVEQLAQEVLLGKHGSGLSRRNSLGDQYEAVQKRVNEILTGEAAESAPDIDALAKAVIAGKYGSGEQRRQALGAHYDAVQKRVNEILRGKA